MKANYLMKGDNNLMKQANYFVMKINYSMTIFSRGKKYFFSLEKKILISENFIKHPGLMRPSFHEQGRKIGHKIFSILPRFIKSSSIYFNRLVTLRDQK
jgi:hypothetical protein